MLGDSGNNGIQHKGNKTADDVGGIVFAAMSTVNNIFGRWNLVEEMGW